MAFELQMQAKRQRQHKGFEYKIKRDQYDIYYVEIIAPKTTKCDNKVLLYKNCPVDKVWYDQKLNRWHFIIDFFQSHEEQFTHSKALNATRKIIMDFLIPVHTGILKLDSQ